MVASLLMAATGFQLPILQPSLLVGARGVQLGTGALGVRQVFAGGVDYLWLFHPSRSCGAFGTEGCTTRAHGNRAGLFFPTKSLDLLCVCSARRNASAARIFRYLGCAVNEAITLIKHQPGTLSQRGPSLFLQ